MRDLGGHIPPLATKALLLVVTTAVLLGLMLSVAAAAPVFWGWRSFITLGGSMEPTIPIGSVVVVQPVLPSEVRVGDIVTVAEREQQRLVTHRVINVLEQEGRLVFETQGDANGVPDGVPRDPADLRGRMVYFVPLAGYMLHYASSWGARVLFLTLVLVMVGVNSRGAFSRKK